MGWQQLVVAFLQAGNTIINNSGLFVYSGSPASGNLLLSITNAGGTDAFGNFIPSNGIFVYGTNGSYIALTDSSNQPELLMRTAAVRQTQAPLIFAFTTNQGIGTPEQQWLVASSGKENSLADAGIQLVSESADATLPAQVIFEFGGTVFAIISESGLEFTGNTPPVASPGNAIIFGTTNGAVNVFDGEDLEQYSTQRRSFGLTGNVAVNSTTFTDIFQTNIAAVGGSRSYRVSGQLVWTAGQAAGSANVEWTAGNVTSGALNFSTKTGAAGAAATGNFVAPAVGQGSSTSLVGTMSNANPYVTDFDGYFTISATSPEAFNLNVACTIAADTWTIRPGSWMDIMPV
jgi:hypothetical protein